MSLFEDETDPPQVIGKISHLPPAAGRIDHPAPRVDEAEVPRAMAEAFKAGRISGSVAQN